eukprot:c4451_g1_i1.p1 GENE.c4451_g1_i1~~c4451_g1_i1.p1  ORF type:complete len:319 (+),score=73.91 c4451_g1_i1:35-991(+)
MDITVRPVPLTCPGHSRPVVFLQYTGITPDGFFLVSASKDGNPMIRDGVTGDWVGTFLGHKGAVWSAAIDRQGLKVATASADFSAKVWDAIVGSELMTFEHPHIVRTIALSSNCDKMVTGCQDKLLRVFDLTSPTPSANPLVLTGHSSTPKIALFGPNDERIFSISEEPLIRVWDLKTCTQITQLHTPLPVTSIELSQDASILTSSCGQQVQFWDSRSLTLIKSFAVGAEVSSVSLHPTNRSFVVGGPDFRVRLMDFDTGREIDTLKSHFGPVHCVRFAPNGESFASSSEDGTIRIWQIESKSSDNSADTSPRDVVAE